MGGRKGWKGSEVEGTGRRKRGGKEKEGGERGGGERKWPPHLSERGCTLDYDHIEAFPAKNCAL